MPDWKIKIKSTPGGDYQVCITHPGGPHDGHCFTRRLPPDLRDLIAADSEDPAPVRWRRPPLEVPGEEQFYNAGDIETLKIIGARLFDALFRSDGSAGSTDLVTALLAHRGSASEEDGLNISIDLRDAVPLASLPWEALYVDDHDRDLFLGIDERSSIVRRHAPAEKIALPRPVTSPARLLVIIADPDGDLSTGPEASDLRRQVAEIGAIEAPSYEVRTLETATRRDVGTMIATWRPHIIHFIGHGGFRDQKGLIYLHDEKDKRLRDPIDSATLRDFVRNDRPWLVVLNSCLGGATARVDPFGGAAQNLIRIGIPFVVAMQAPISDEAAVSFSRCFYEALLKGASIGVAITRGRNAINTQAGAERKVELATPVLYSSGEARSIEFEKPTTPPVPPEAAKVHWTQTVPVWVGVGTFILATAGLLLEWSKENAPQPAAEPPAIMVGNGGGTGASPVEGPGIATATPVPVVGMPGLTASAGRSAVTSTSQGNPGEQVSPGPTPSPPSPSPPSPSPPLPSAGWAARSEGAEPPVWNDPWDIGAEPPVSGERGAEPPVRGELEDRGAERPVWNDPGERGVEPPVWNDPGDRGAGRARS